VASESFNPSLSAKPQTALPTGQSNGSVAKLPLKKASVVSPGDRRHDCQMVTIPTNRSLKWSSSPETESIPRKSHDVKPFDIRLPFDGVHVQSEPSKLVTDLKRPTFTDVIHQNTSSRDFMSLPFTYLSLINNSTSSDGIRVYHVKAYIATLLSRLEHNNGQFWSLLAKINDGTATLDVNIGNEMLTELIGFTAEQSLKIKEGKFDRSCRQLLAEGVRHCQEILTCLSAILDIEISNGQPACVVKYHAVTAADVSALRRRVMVLSK
jgi:hypothetical protein